MVYYTGFATYSKDTGVIRHENELTKKKKHGSCEGKTERENDVDGSLNNAVGIIGCLQDADNNVARAAYNSLRIMCTTQRWGSVKVTLQPAGCLFLSQRGTSRHNEISEEEHARACVRASHTHAIRHARVCRPSDGVKLMSCWKTLLAISARR